MYLHLHYIRLNKCEYEQIIIIFSRTSLYIIEMMKKLAHL